MISFHMESVRRLWDLLKERFEEHSDVLQFMEVEFGALKLDNL